MPKVPTEEALQFLLDQIAAQRVALLGLLQVLSRSGAIDLAAFADRLVALRLSGETDGAVTARAELAEMIRAGGPSSPPSLRVVSDNDDGEDRLA